MRLGKSLYILIFGLVFAACGCLFSALFGQTATLTCTRVEPAQVECVQRIRWLGLVPIRTETVHDLRGAAVDQRCDDESCTYRIELSAGEDITPMTSYYSSGLEAKQETAQRINAFLAGESEPSLTVKSDAGLLSYGVPFLFIAVGLLIALSAPISFLRGRL